MPTVSIIGTRGYPSYYGGFETAVRKLAPYLVEKGWNVTVYGRPGSVLFDDPDRNPFVDSRMSPGIDRKSLSTLTYGLTSSINTVIRNPDVALIMNVANGFFLPLLRLRGIPTLVNVDGIEWEREKWSDLAKRAFISGAKLTAKFATELVSDSLEIRRRWIDDFKRDSVFIPYGGDIPAALPLEPGLVHRGYVLYVARFVPENTVLEFLQAAPDIAKHFPVVIVGSSGYGGPIEKQIRDLAGQNPNVRWLGHISDDKRLLSLWQHAGVYFHGHSVGGTNPTLVQAMAAGAPVVARDTAFNREVLDDGGVFCQADSTEIYTAIKRVFTDRSLQDVLIAKNLSRAKKEYNWRSVCEAYDAALRNTMELGSVSPRL